MNTSKRVKKLYNIGYNFRTIQHKTGLSYVLIFEILSGVE